LKSLNLVSGVTGREEEASAEAFRVHLRMFFATLAVKGFVQVGEKLLTAYISSVHHSKLVYDGPRWAERWHARL